MQIIKTCNISEFCPVFSEKSIYTETDSDCIITHLNYSTISLTYGSKRTCQYGTNIDKYYLITGFNESGEVDMKEEPVPFQNQIRTSSIIQLDCNASIFVINKMLIEKRNIKKSKIGVAGLPEKCSRKTFTGATDKMEYQYKIEETTEHKLEKKTYTEKQISFKNNYL